MAPIINLKRLRQKLAIRTNLRKLQREWIAYLAFCLKPRNPEQKRIVIFAQGRTGSTLLENLICSTDRIQENGELISRDSSPFKRRILFPYHYVCGLAKMTPKHFMFHVKIYHLTEDLQIDPSQFLQKLSATGWKIIYLHRDNNVMHVMSNILAKERGSYHKFNEKKEEFHVKVDLNYLVSWVNKRARYAQIEKDCLQSLDYVDVAYERDLQDNTLHQETADRIFDFLGIDRQYVSTKMKKINTKKLEDIVVNYDEFEQCVLDNGWGLFLEEKR